MIISLCCTVVDPRNENKGFVTNSIYISVYIKTYNTLLLDVPSNSLQNKKSGFVMIPDFISIFKFHCLMFKTLERPPSPSRSR